jgi:tetratricopeptide (TPR) repeat protein
MKTQGFIQYWNLVKGRVITFYLVVILIFLSVVDYQKVFSHARGAALNRFMPDFVYLNNLVQGREGIDKKRLQEYASYYEKVTEYLPRADGLGILGYLYFHLGKDKKAVVCFKKAAKLYPDAFNFHYNLGIIYFRRGYYEESAEALKSAVGTSVSKNLNYITSSRVYFPFLGNHEDVGPRLALYLRNGFRNAYRLLVFSCYNLKQYQEMLAYSSQAIAASLDENKDFYFYAGIAAYQLGKYEQAGAFLKEYLGSNPQDGNALYYLGMTLFGLGDKDDGTKILKAAETLHGSPGITETQSDTISLYIF